MGKVAKSCVEAAKHYLAAVSGRLSLEAVVGTVGMSCLTERGSL